MSASKFYGLFPSHETGLALAQQRNAQVLANSFTLASVRDKRVRTDRAAEEFIELLQTAGMDLSRLHQMADSIYRRPAGVLWQEFAGAQICLMALATAHGVNLADGVSHELLRIQNNAKQMIAKGHAKPTFEALRHPAGLGQWGSLVNLTHALWSDVYGLGDYATFQATPLDEMLRQVLAETVKDRARRGATMAWTPKQAETLKTHTEALRVALGIMPGVDWSDILAGTVDRIRHLEILGQTRDKELVNLKGQHAQQAETIRQLLRGPVELVEAQKKIEAQGRMIADLERELFQVKLAAAVAHDEKAALFVRLGVVHEEKAEFARAVSEYEKLNEELSEQVEELTEQLAPATSAPKDAEQPDAPEPSDELARLREATAKIAGDAIFLVGERDEARRSLDNLQRTLDLSIARVAELEQSERDLKKRLHAAISACKETEATTETHEEAYQARVKDLEATLGVLRGERAELVMVIKFICVAVGMPLGNAAPEKLAEHKALTPDISASDLDAAMPPVIEGLLDGVRKLAEGYISAIAASRT